MYRTIDAAFWTDPKVRKLNWSGKNLLLYLITNPHTHVSGIYNLSLSTITHETGQTSKQIIDGIDTLSSLEFCRFDAETEVVWVKNMMRYQGRGEKNLRSAVHHLAEDLHHSPLIAEFIEFYPDIKPLISDRVSIRYPEKSGDATPDSRSLNPDTRYLNTDIRTPEPVLTFGEFQAVRLTDSEHVKLLARLNGNLEGFINRLDRYSQTHPAKFKQYRSHYAVILSWSDKDAKQEHPKTLQSQRPTREEIDAKKKLMGFKV